MESSHTTSRQHGLTLMQWGVLLVAFMLGMGGSLIVREIFPPHHMGDVQAAPLSSSTSQ